MRGFSNRSSRRPLEQMLRRRRRRRRRRGAADADAAVGRLRHPLLDVPGVLITPHIGYNTREASANMLRIAIETVQAFARGERLHVVNAV